MVHFVNKYTHSGDILKILSIGVDDQNYLQTIPLDYH